jgi:hypothetical protein
MSLPTKSMVHRRWVINASPLILLGKVEQIQLLSALAGEIARGPAHDSGLVLKRAENATAAGALVDIVLDLHHPVRGLVLLRIATTRRQLDLTEAKRATVRVEALQRLLLRQQPTPFVASWIASSISSKLPLSCT